MSKKLGRRFFSIFVVITVAFAMIIGQSLLVSAEDTPTTATPAPTSGWTQDQTQYYIDGVMATGWQQIGSHTYYFDTATGVRYLGLKDIGGKYYYFSKTSKPMGSMAKGWRVLDSHKYYFDTETGEMHLGYTKIGENHYYFSKAAASRGQMGTGRWVTDKGVKHWIKGNGKEIKATKYMAFTFDDGPSVNTPNVVKVLKEYGCTATFFEVGYRVHSYSSAEKKILASGSEIGNHSWNHADLAKLSSGAISTQISKTNNRIKKYSGETVKLVRPPYGSVNGTVQRTVGAPLIMWNVDTRDWAHRNTAKTVAAIMKHPADGNIVLMHDLYPTSYHASAIAIPRLIKKGYKIVSVSELAKLHHKTLKKGTIYYSIR